MDVVITGSDGAKHQQWMQVYSGADHMLQKKPYFKLIVMVWLVICQCSCRISDFPDNIQKNVPKNFL